MEIEVGIPVITYNRMYNGNEFTVVPCRHNDAMQTINLSNEAILAIGDRYFELKQNSAKDSMIQKEL